MLLSENLIFIYFFVFCLWIKTGRDATKVQPVWPICKPMNACSVPSQAFEAVVAQWGIPSASTCSANCYSTFRFKLRCESLPSSPHHQPHLKVALLHGFNALCSSSARKSLQIGLKLLDSSSLYSNPLISRPMSCAPTHLEPSVK